MDDSIRLKSLSIALRAIGAIATFAFYPLMVLWPSGWTWHSGHSHYPLMIVGIYATLGVFLMRAARRPLEHLSLIWFTVWSSVAHGAIMTLQSLMTPGHLGHLLGDVPALFIVDAVLAVLTARASGRGRAAATGPAGELTQRSTLRGFVPTKKEEPPG